MRRITGKVVCRNSETSCVALPQAVFHHKESLVLIRSLKRGLVLHFLFFKNEICGFDAIATGDGVKVTNEDLKLGRGLIEKMSSAHFEPERYADELPRARTGYD